MRSWSAYLFADDGELVVLELLEALIDVDVADDARRVDHARAKEPARFVLERVSSGDAQYTYHS